MKTSGLPFRMSEGNSCWDGGKPGVSDTLASALWCADTMLRFAAMGWCGVNLHGGGNGFYTPIAGAPSSGFTRRPEFYGIQFAQRLVGASFVESKLEGSATSLKAYTLQKAGRLRIAMINRSDTAIPVELSRRVSGHAMRLSGPDLESKEGIELREVKIPRSNRVIVEGHTGMIYEL